MEGSQKIPLVMVDKETDFLERFSMKHIIGQHLAMREYYLNPIFKSAYLRIVTCGVHAVSKISKIVQFLIAIRAQIEHLVMREYYFSLKSTYLRI